jgi:hypothetical protein
MARCKRAQQWRFQDQDEGDGSTGGVLVRPNTDRPLGLRTRSVHAIWGVCEPGTRKKTYAGDGRRQAAALRRAAAEDSMLIRNFEKYPLLFSNNTPNWDRDYGSRSIHFAPNIFHIPSYIG